MVKEWPSIKVGDVFAFKNGLSKGKEYFGHGTPFISYVEVYKHNSLTAADIKGRVTLTENEIRKLAVRKNDVFFTRTSETPEEVGYSAVLMEDVPDCVFNGFVLRARPKNTWLDPQYCKYCFSTKAVREQIAKKSKYTTRAGITGRALSEIEIPLPSIEEQQAIAEALSSMDIHIDNMSQLIKKKKDVRDGAIEDLVSGKTRLAGFVKPWEEVELGRVGTFTKGAPLSKSHISNRGTPFILYGELYTTYHEVTYKVFRHTEESAADEHYSRVGDVIIPTSGETAEEIATSCCVMVPGVILAGDLNIYRSSEFDGRFLSHVISHVANRQISELAQGISIIHINAKKLQRIAVCHPEKEEQSAIADIIDTMDREIAALEDERDKMFQIREGAMDDLLTGRVRLKI